MDHSYWLTRKNSSIGKPDAETNDGARLINVDLAGRYGVKAAAAAPSTEETDDDQ